MTDALATRETTPSMAAIEQVLIKGDLSALTDAQRLAHYRNVCLSLGLNPLTQPFDYLKLSGKMVLYAKRDAAEQLRKINGVSITSVQTQHYEGVYIVTATAQDKTGRTDVSTGVVPLGTLKGEALANQLMKAETKAKRRVTLSICGLGMLDETEVETIPGARTGTQPTYTIEAQKPDVLTSELSPEANDDGPDLGTDIPEGAALIKAVKVGEGPKGSHGVIVLMTGEELPVFSQQRLAVCEKFCTERIPVVLDIRLGKQSGKPYLWEVKSLAQSLAPTYAQPGEDTVF